jgi:hypothetical protein
MVWYSVDRKFHTDEKESFSTFSAAQHLKKTKKMCSLFPWQHAISFLFNLLKVLQIYKDFVNFTELITNTSYRWP